MRKSVFTTKAKRILSVFAAFVLIFGILPISALAAAPQNLVFSKDSTLKASFTKYGNITVKSGVTLTIDKNSGFEIAGNITVEKGGKIVCNGVGSGQFTFSICTKNAKVTGMDLYFVLETKTGNEIRKVADGFAGIAAMDCWDWMGWNPCFKWNSTVQGWCLTEATNVNLSDEPIYHSERDMDGAKLAADRINRLGLFQGGSNGYALTREGSRIEALVMLIRLLGKEEEALSGTWTHPFIDVPAWADKYVGYAYEKGLTKGTTATKFGTGNTSAQMYFTFLARALGNEDTKSFSVYDHALELAEKYGLLKEENLVVYWICKNKFWRSDMVVASYRALTAQTSTGETLGERLVAEGVFTEEQLRNELH